LGQCVASRRREAAGPSRRALPLVDPGGGRLTMPSLLDNLSSSFSSDGFDLGTAFGALGQTVSGIAPAGASLDEGALGRIGQGLGQGGFGAIGYVVPGVVALVRLLGALMSSDALTREVASTASSIQAMLDPQSAEAALAKLSAAAGTGLPELIAAADPNDPIQVATVAQPVAAFA